MNLHVFYGIVVKGDEDLKRICVYSFDNKLLFSGNMNDIPLNDEKLYMLAKEKYGDRLCPQRAASIRANFISDMFSKNTREISVEEEHLALLKHKNAHHIIVSDD